MTETRDQTRPAAKPARRPHDLHARDVMSTPVLVIDVDDTIWHAWSCMRESGRRHLVVCEGARCVGVLDDRTLFAHWPTGPLSARSTPIRGLIRSRTTCVLPGSTLARVARVMVNEEIDAVPVTDESGVILGIVTGGDIAAAVARYDLGHQLVDHVDAPADPIKDTGGRNERTAR
jgi:CBS-domain-containing membrane protein